MAHKQPKTIETLRHPDAARLNIPTAEYQAVMADADKAPIQLAYERRNRDLDPQLVWRGKDEQDWSDLVVPAPPLYIQEKIQPKVLIDDLLRQSAERAQAGVPQQVDMFADFNGLPAGADATEFYRHEGNWTNRMILGDSLQVMASLAEREGLRGQVQCIYLDPPYGIKFNSNFQWSTTSRDVKDGKGDHITREPEQVKAFRDTWRDGIHSYLTYLRDRLTVARDLLAESGSIFVQIGDENVHRVRALMDEVFGDENFITQLLFKKTGSMSGNYISGVADTLLWYGKNRNNTKFRRLVTERSKESIDSGFGYIEQEDGICRRLTAKELGNEETFPLGERFQTSPLMSSGETQGDQAYQMCGATFYPAKGRHWAVALEKLPMIQKAGRLYPIGNTLTFKKYLWESLYTPLINIWMDTMESTFAVQRIFVVQTATKVIQRCILMSTDPGDLVLDPTCGSGTTAYVAEQWGRRWITIDTSRVALALARARIMGARYPYYLLADSKAGQRKEAELTQTAPSTAPTYGNLRHGFVYGRVPHITLKAIANNAEIDVIWEQYQQILEPLREQLNAALGTAWEEWEIPREIGEGRGEKAEGKRKKEEEIHPSSFNPHPSSLLAQWWEARIARQRAMDASIAAHADQEFLYDQPYEDNKVVRVAGPFTVESLSPHRVLIVDEEDELRPVGKFVEEKNDYDYDYDSDYDFTGMILENLRAAGVQQAHKQDRIAFTALAGWPGHYLCAEGRYMEGDKERRAGIFIGPEFGTVSRPDLVAAAREAADAGFDVLIACAFNYDAHSAEFEKLGRIPVLKARMNAELHMADALKSTGGGNLFVIFGEPDIEILDASGGEIQVKIRGVDVFHPQSGEVRSSGPEGIACWFIDTDYNEESFFVRHAYFLGANDPYQSLKTTLKAEIDAEAWESLHSDVSRPFPKPSTGRIAVKVINHLGDEVMKVFSVS